MNQALNFPDIATDGHARDLPFFFGGIKNVEDVIFYLEKNEVSFER